LPIPKTLNAVVYKEGDPAHYAYIIKSGEFKVTCRSHRKEDGKTEMI
jgi:CRP-like cAMP-binding protein